MLRFAAFLAYAAFFSGIDKAAVVVAAVRHLAFFPSFQGVKKTGSKCISQFFPMPGKMNGSMEN
jgi:hypothetical protein